MERVIAALIFATLLFAARVIIAAQIIRFHVSTTACACRPYVIDIIRRADYAYQYTNNMANLPLKWLFPRVH